MLKKLKRKKWKFLSATGTQHRSIMVSLQQESLQGFQSIQQVANIE
jgi:hydroxymethylpyrimidine pyrophosphatase-like HAD family hydrolase